MKKTNEIQGLSYSIRFKGLFGRNRKVKGGSETLVGFTETPLTTPEIQSLVDAYLITLRPKPGFNWCVETTKATQATYDDGFYSPYVMNGFVLGSHEVVLVGSM